MEKHSLLTSCTYFPPVAVSPVDLPLPRSWCQAKIILPTPLTFQRKRHPLGERRSPACWFTKGFIFSQSNYLPSRFGVLVSQLTVLINAVVVTLLVLSQVCNKSPWLYSPFIYRRFSSTICCIKLKNILFGVNPVHRPDSRGAAIRAKKERRQAPVFRDASQLFRSQPLVSRG